MAKQSGEKVHVGGDEITEIRHGLKRLKGALKRHAQLSGPLELEDRKRNQLSEQYKQLTERLSPEEGDVPTKTIIEADEIYAVRVSLRLRHGGLKRLQSKEQKEGCEPGVDTLAKIAAVEKLGTLFGIQLDAIEHGEDDEEED